MNKKSQNIGQIFIYMLAIVVVGIILIFGYRSITQINDRTKQLAILEFENKLESSVKSIASEYGTKRVKEFILSKEYEEVCILNMTITTGTAITNAQYRNMTQDYPIIEDSIDDVTKTPLKNVFLIKKNKEIAESFDIPLLQLQKGNIFNCFPVENSRVELTIEGRGNHAIIS